MGVGRGGSGCRALGCWCLPLHSGAVGAHFRPVCLSPHQSQGALAGRLRSFSMQDLRSIPDETPVHYRDPLYLEEQESRRQLLGELGGGKCSGGGLE